MKKSDQTLLIVFLLVGAFIYGGSQGWFNGFAIQNPFGPGWNLPYPDDPMPIDTSYDLMLTISPERICVDDWVTGSIDSNINNGLCGVFMRTPATNWAIYKTITLNGNGDYSENNQMRTAGTLYTIAVCCDAQNNCKVSNQADLIVEVCDGDGGDGFNPTTYTCGTMGLNCGGTCPSDYPVCGEVYFGLYTSACVCINEQTEMVAPDWKPGAANYHPVTEDMCSEDCVNYGLPEYYTGNKGGYQGQCTNQYMMESYTHQIDCCCYRDTTPFNPSLFTCDWYCTENTAWQGGPFDYGYALDYTGCSAKSLEVCGHQAGIMSVGGAWVGFPPVCCCFNC